MGLVIQVGDEDSNGGAQKPLYTEVTLVQVIIDR